MIPKKSSLPKPSRWTQEAILASLRRARKGQSRLTLYKGLAAAASLFLAVLAGVGSAELCRRLEASRPAERAAASPALKIEELHRFLDRSARASARRTLEERDAWEAEQWAQR
ncbi:MAG: hypothetical protein HY717_15340 [Planctomycetes bacterium]|nr:hypothetical protein [Planctomycetota bacterium]